MNMIRVKVIEPSGVYIRGLGHRGVGEFFEVSPEVAETLRGRRGLVQVNPPLDPPPNSGGDIRAKRPSVKSSDGDKSNE